MATILKTLAAAVSITLGLLAQTQPAGSPAFEVASIKPHPEPITVSNSSTSGTLATWTAVTLIDLISSAYDLNHYQQISGGPNWATSAHFDIAARGSGDAPLTKEQVGSMLQALLADRFQLKVHRETKEVPAYALVVGRNGTKLQDPDMSKPVMRTTANSAGVHITGWHSNMEQLANQLSVTAGRPVLDKTGITGIYAYQLDFNLSNNFDHASDSDIPIMSTAVQEQLGLRLEPQKAPIEILVIDSAEKPSGN
jgi:uncharacterized protein (TIGR03435 family)